MSDGTPREQREATRDGRTHWDGCWEHFGHHGCAIARVRELEAARSPGGRERELLEKIVMRAIKDGTYWRLDLDLQDEIRAALSAVPVGAMCDNNREDQTMTPAAPPPPSTENPE